jgi:hypothetical protein
MATKIIGIPILVVTNTPKFMVGSRWPIICSSLSWSAAVLARPSKARSAGMALGEVKISHPLGFDYLTMETWKNMKNWGKIH